MLFEGAVLQEPHPGGLRPPTFPAPRVGAANRDCSTRPSDTRFEQGKCLILRFATRRPVASVESAWSSEI